MLPVRSLVRLAFTAVPRLYGAARAAGAGRSQALDVLADSVLVLAGAARHSPTRWREQNAIRHFTWQAWLTARHGRDLARAVARAQERGREDSADSAVDRRNNATGQEYGAAHADELRERGRLAAIGHLLELGSTMFRAGELAREGDR